MLLVYVVGHGDLYLRAATSIYSCIKRWREREREGGR